MIDRSQFIKSCPPVNAQIHGVTATVIRAVEGESSFFDIFMLFSPTFEPCFLGGMPPWVRLRVAFHGLRALDFSAWLGLIKTRLRVAIPSDWHKSCSCSDPDFYTSIFI